MKYTSLGFCLTVLLTPQAIAYKPDPIDLQWQTITFGQSTDLNFGSSILPEKVGLNQVTHSGEPVKAGPLAESFSIESRGGKLANSHEGLTFYYTTLPADINFTLSADITLEQLGPETGATPNRQEGAGIMVRDTLGKARLDPQPQGHEEFPSASNMVMNLLRSHSRSNDGMVNINASFREGIYQPWGTSGNRLSRVDYAEAIPYGDGTTYRMSLTRTNQGFEVGYRQNDVENFQPVKGANANIISVQDPKNQYLGFFASRNAKISVSNVSMTLTEADTQNTPHYQAKQEPVVFERASSELASGKVYTAQARANYSGVFELVHNGSPAGKQKITAGELYTQTVHLADGVNKFEIRYTPDEGPDLTPLNQAFSVENIEVADPMVLIVSPEGNASGNGSLSSPLDLATAAEILPPGGTIKLLEGDYPAQTIPLTASGSESQLKKLIAVDTKVRFTGQLVHKANYWHYTGVEVAGASFIVHGSHNTFEKMVTHSAPDTGFQITSPEQIGRALWASYNTVLDSKSYNNMDPSQINADGFAAKMRVGDGNTFIRCLSHHNIDDGWDLFNKVEDGPNGVVTIKDSIAFMNGQTLTVKPKGASLGNGFKLGGEGLPVPHVIINSLAYRNNMDGFTDNFNPGALTLNNNVAIDNKRFNFLLRKSPYGDDVKQGVFENNHSYRFYVTSPYADVVHADTVINSTLLSNPDTLTKTRAHPALQLLKKAAVLDPEKTIPGKQEALNLHQQLQ